MSLSHKMAQRENAICWRGFGEKYEYANSGIYFIKPRGKGTPIKIGRACDIERRLKELQTYEKLEVVCVCKYDRQEKLETAFHQVFHLRRIQIDYKNTEWFNITVEDIKKLLSREEVIKCVSTGYRWSIQFTPFVEQSSVQQLENVARLAVISENDTLLCLLLDHLDSSSDFLWDSNLESFLKSSGISKKYKCEIEENTKGLCYHFPLFRHINFYLFTSMSLTSKLNHLVAYTNVGTNAKSFYDTRPDLYSIFKSKTIEEAKANPLYGSCLIPDSQKPKICTSKPVYSTVVEKTYMY